MKRLHLICCPLLLAACQSVPAVEPSRRAAPPAGAVFAQASCGSCHAVAPGGVSANPNAPPFAELVNKEGVTSATLSTWLKGAHNYPDEMNFTLYEREVDALVDYMLTLKDPNYVRPPG
jgi:mono/diheme cytochrome c family protein